MRSYKNISPLQFSEGYNYQISPFTSNKDNKGWKILLFIILIFTFYAILDFKNFAFNFIFVSNIIYFINFAFKFILFYIYLNTKSKQHYTEVKNLPIYTVLLPCYKEERETLENLIFAISSLKYPKHKLDIKFLLEEDDTQTINNLKEINHDFEVHIIPNLIPKTKPKACNFGLYYAKGKFIVIYDAEDRPEPNQLLKAVHYFENINDDKIICLQAKLNFYNAYKNILSKCFCIEYLIWFNCFLPAIVKMNMFIPLGGTSNHFKTQKLIEIGGWDAYNVTEDAELGLRIKKNGYKSAVLNSYTMEEAPFKIIDWFFQRKRWMKGYLQTFLVHLLDFKGNKKLNLANFCGIFLLIGFSFFSFFLVPFTVFFALFAKVQNLFLYYLMLINAICILFYITIFLMITKREGFEKYTHYGFLMPFYFLLHSSSALLAFYDFFIKPFYWDKTKHSVK